MERNRRNDSDIGEAERLSILERKKRAVLNSSAEPIPCLRKAFLLTELAKEVIKDWRRPAAVLLRLAILFGLSALIGETFVALLTGGH